MKQESTIRVVLFDLGNVLVDLGDVSEMHRMLNTEGEESDVWLKWLSSPTVAAFDSGKISFDKFAKDLLAEVGSNIDKDVFKASFKAWPRGLFDGALELVAAVKPEYHRAILSNTNAAHWPRLMDEMALAGKFHSYYASHQVGFVKPDAAIYYHVIESLKVSPDQILFIDDNQVNIDTACALGMKAHRVKGIEQARQVLEQYKVLSS
ncbi:MAG: HAD family hydrolase [Marinomonas foliarum]|jgi:glucose-1-phosphatase|uniref:Putative hydrolase of the HAD superfamily n=1 Tax=Marinomonas foliarum TaxID=491950 RepID=A0A369A5S3_9GAMM|nr:HAD family phosphatase [Marinomonas foliarum]RCX03427.1 putative hydrolase of the HAD superfamily [Marinomonas foliarum]